MCCVILWYQIENSGKHDDAKCYNSCAALFVSKRILILLWSDCNATDEWIQLENWMTTTLSD